MQVSKNRDNALQALQQLRCETRPCAEVFIKLIDTTSQENYVHSMYSPWWQKTWNLFLYIVHTINYSNKNKRHEKKECQVIVKWLRVGLMAHTVHHTIWTKLKIYNICLLVSPSSPAYRWDKSTVELRHIFVFLLHVHTSIFSTIQQCNQSTIQKQRHIWCTTELQTFQIES